MLAESLTGASGCGFTCGFWPNVVAMGTVRNAEEAST